MNSSRIRLLSLFVAEKNRLATAINAVRPHIEAHITWLAQDMEDLDGGLGGLSAGVPCGERGMVSCAPSSGWGRNSP